MYITFEGPEACGKSTQAAMLAEYLEANGEKVFLTKEPGSPSDPVCQKIRQLILAPANKINHKAAFFLFLADRAQHMESIIDALEDGKHVISDRSSLSTLVYYLAGIGEIDITRKFERLAPILSYAHRRTPDLCFMCPADYDWCEAKLKERDARDRIESFDKDFHHRVHNLFRQYSSLSMKGKFDKLYDFEPRELVVATPASHSTIDDVHKFIKDWTEKRIVAEQRRVERVSQDGAI